jgi:hypothetical protein
MHSCCKIAIALTAQSFQVSFLANSRPNLRTPSQSSTLVDVSWDSFYNHAILREVVR